MNVQRPVISIIVAVYNREDLLPRCLDTLVFQTLDEPYEVILVDDQSTDASWEVMSRWSDRYPEKVRVFHNPNKGVANAKNLGIANAVGEYVAFVDSDDYVPYDAFERLFARAVESDRPELVVSPICKVSNGCTTTIGSLDGVSDVQLALLRGNYFFLPGKLIRRDLFERFGLLPILGISEDVSWVFPVVSAVDRIAVEYKPTYFYEYSANSVSTSFESESLAKDAAMASRRILDNTEPRYRAFALDYVIRRTEGYLFSKFPHHRQIFVDAIREDLNSFIALSSSVPDLRSAAGAVRLLLGPVMRVVGSGRLSEEFATEVSSLSSYAMLRGGTVATVAKARKLLAQDGSEGLGAEAKSLSVIRDCDLGVYAASEMPESVREAEARGDDEFVRGWRVARTLFERGGLYLHSSLEQVGCADALAPYDVVVGYSGDADCITGKALYAKPGSRFLKEVLATYDDASVATRLIPFGAKLRLVSVGYAGLPLQSKRFVDITRNFCALPIESFIANPARSADVPIISFDRTMFDAGRFAGGGDLVSMCYERRLTKLINECSRLSEKIKRMVPAKAGPKKPLAISSAGEAKMRALVREVGELKSSTAYRVGMIVTWPARKIYRLFRLSR